MSVLSVELAGGVDNADLQRRCEAKDQLSQPGVRVRRVDGGRSEGDDGVGDALAVEGRELGLGGLDYTTCSRRWCSLVDE